MGEAAMRTTPAQTLAFSLRWAHIEFIPEFRFHPRRKWRADFYIPAGKILLEVDGGTWLPGGGRHNRGQGYENDCEKLNEATALGFFVLRVTPRQIQNGKALEWVQHVLAIPRASAAE
jgi:very-short-patch-repair endonuclease